VVKIHAHSNDTFDFQAVCDDDDDGDAEESRLASRFSSDGRLYGDDVDDSDGDNDDGDDDDDDDAFVEDTRTNALQVVGRRKALSTLYSQTATLVSLSLVQQASAWRGDALDEVKLICNTTYEVAQATARQVGFDLMSYLALPKN
jgi:hypothetical protein